MMRNWSLVILAFAAFALPACGYKGKLKSPSQIEQINAKKAHKAAKEEGDAATPEASPAPTPSVTPTPTSTLAPN